MDWPNFWKATVGLLTGIALIWGAMSVLWPERYSLWPRQTKIGQWLQFRHWKLGNEGVQQQFWLEIQFAGNRRLSYLGLVHNARNAVDALFCVAAYILSEDVKEDSLAMSVDADDWHDTDFYVRGVQLLYDSPNCYMVFSPASRRSPRTGQLKMLTMSEGLKDKIVTHEKERLLLPSD